MTFYDNVDWHVDAAKQAHQPKKNAFAHIGLYLAWLARHDMTTDDFIRRDWVEAIKSGKMSGSDLTGAVDGALASEMMTTEGRAFTDFYYQGYLDDFAATFPEVGNYGVIDSLQSYARLAPVIDDRYANWVSSGRPPRDTVDSTSSSEGYLAAEDVVSLFEQVHSIFGDSGLSITYERAGSQPIPKLPTTPRIDELERLARAASPEEPAVKVMSRPANLWGDPLLTRALKRLSVPSKMVTVTTAMWSLRPNRWGGQDTMLVVLYDVPDVAADRLIEEFGTVIHTPKGAKWERTEVSGKDVRIARGKESPVVYWADDGIVYTVASPESHIDEFVGRLP